jgi:cytochrome c biogenesis protein CcdA
MRKLTPSSLITFCSADSIEQANYVNTLSVSVLLMIYRISSSSHGQIGRVADNTLSKKVTVFLQNLAGLSKSVHSPCILAVIPASIKYGRYPYLKYRQPHSLIEGVALQTPERRKWTTRLEFMELEKQHQ